jgi:hypothetical protein
VSRYAPQLENAIPGASSPATSYRLASACTARGTETTPQHATRSYAGNTTGTRME